SPNGGKDLGMVGALLKAGRPAGPPNGLFGLVFAEESTRWDPNACKHREVDGDGQQKAGQSAMFPNGIIGVLAGIVGCVTVCLSIAGREVLPNGLFGGWASTGFDWVVAPNERREPPNGFLRVWLENRVG